MQIKITHIRIGAISNIGSLNIGKNILCNNQASIQEVPGPPEEAPVDPYTAETPAIGQLSIPHEFQSPYQPGIGGLP
ncbi:hypothetical protein [Caldalkalibacillus mannanilyticus]|uniref:hypothetical protein n=1 Tax=Caldalkalibacillus mannanilyticus TaxID=1418 RepID=UPI0004689182|nr:hypothetical protein [Caldalkalibacillus mannanilyticus]